MTTETPATEKNRPQWIRQAVDFGALVAFIGAYFLVVAAANEVFRSEAAVLAIWDAFGWATPDPDAVWTSFRGVLWIAASVFGLSQIPVILKHMIKDEEPGPVSPDTGL